MKPGPKEIQITAMREKALGVGDQEIAAASADPGLVAKAVRMYLRHRAHARERMRKLRQKEKDS